KTLILDIVVGDCEQSGHYGYGYFDIIGCGPFKVETIVGECDLDAHGVKLEAPPGYKYYQVWTNNFSQLVNTSQDNNIFAYHPVTTTLDTYKVVMIPYESVRSCPDTVRIAPRASFYLD